MAEPQKDLTNESAVIKAIQQQHETEIAELKKQFEEDKAKALKEQEAKHIENIRALMSGRKYEDTPPKQNNELGFEETILHDLRIKNKIIKE